MLETLHGIVLRTVKYKDNAFIADVFTRQLGRASLMVALPRTRKAAVKPMLFQPLSAVEVVAEVRPGATIYKVKEAKLLCPFASLPYDPYKSSIALFLSEFLCRAVREEGPDEPLFSYLLYSLEWLDACPKGFANFHLVFLMRFSRFLGLLPNLDDYSEGCYFDLLNAHFTPVCPVGHRYYIMPAEAKALHAMMRMDYGTMHLFRMTRAERWRCLKVMTDYYRLHLPDFPELRSVEVLRELFD